MPPPSEGHTSVPAVMKKFFIFSTYFTFLYTNIILFQHYACKVFASNCKKQCRPYFRPFIIDAVVNVAQCVSVLASGRKFKHGQDGYNHLHKLTVL